MNIHHMMVKINKNMNMAFVFRMGMVILNNGKCSGSGRGGII